MRLIDADALIEEFDLYTDRKGYLKADPEDLIDNAPTIKTFTLLDIEEQYRKGLEKGLSEWETERPQGEWKEFIMPVPVSDNHYKIGVICSECNTTWDCSTNYCPYCGADMRGNKE